MTNLFNLSIVAGNALLSIRLINRNNIAKHRISSIIGIISVVFIFTIYIQSIGSGIYDDSGLFQITTWTQLIHSLALVPIKNKNKNKQIFKWENIEIPTKKGIFLNKQIINSQIDQFWSKNIEKISKDLHLLILTRIKFENGEFSTLGNLQKLNIEDKDYYTNYLSSILDLKSDYYINTPMIGFTISYGFREGRLPEKQFSKNNNIKNLTYYHYKLPLTLDPLKYGQLIDHDGNKYYSQINKTNVAIINVQDKNKNNVKIFKSGILVLEYLDIKVSESSFTREIGKNTYYITNEKIDLVTTQKSVKFINKITKTKSLNNFLTLDTETYVDPNNNITPYSISIYDGERDRSYSFYITDFKCPEDMISTAINSILLRKYDGYSVYIHNFAKFDVFFIFKILIKLGNIRPIIHKGKIISIKLFYSPNENNNRKYSIEFKDSYQILLSSLQKLAKSFNVEDKGIFPYNFVNENNLNYIGKVPEIKHFNNITSDQYKDLTSMYDNNWNLKKETIRYCEQDCKSLYQVISKFQDLIFEYFKVNIHKYPTLPGLSFAIFRNKYLPRLQDVKIPQIAGKLLSDIKKSYTGGAVDVYIPSFLPSDGAPNNRIYGYDVNSLYPHVMKCNPMPVGKPIYFQGDIRKVKNNAFGFFYCNITTPDNLQHPILQTHVETPNGIRTIAGLGNYSDWIFSEELYNAEKYGYKFEILHGYTFEKGYIFADFINELYNIRTNFPKSDPMNFISKILMNSQYGKYGMDDNFLNIRIMDKIEFEKFMCRENTTTNNIIEIDDKYLVQYINSHKVDKTLLDNASETHNINIAIAAATTAYARIFMSQFKNNPKYKIYYTDTDSIFIGAALDDNLISNTELGKLKLEYVIKKAVFLSSKVYCLITDSDALIYKVKGLSHGATGSQAGPTLSFSDFETLLAKDSKLEINQEKWFKSLTHDVITIKEQLYTLKVTSNKRQLIYDSNNKFIETRPYIINTNKTIGP